MEQSKDNKAILMTSVNSGKLREVTTDVAYYTNQIVNLVMLGKAGSNWILVDAGMPKSASEIISVAEERYGKGNGPSAIILTHGHFDHTGSIVDLINRWNVPAYAHPLEFPYLTGEQAYPEPDTSVEGGMLAKISSFYPHEPVNISEALVALPANGTIPHLPDWEWIHVPGHTSGQVALYRKADGILLAADAFVTVKQDAMYNVLLQKQEVCGPPVYLTTDWNAAHDSVKKLAALKPQTAITGHGTAMQGAELAQGLQHLVNNWKEIAVPAYGKWVNNS